MSGSIEHTHAHEHLGGIYGERIEHHSHPHSHAVDFVGLGGHKDRHRPHEHTDDDLRALKEKKR